MPKILNEPLAHFVLLGTLLFIVFFWVRGPGEASEDKIVVSAGRVEQLANIFVKTWQRSPTREELQALIDDFVLEEIYYRRAVEMEIDRDDTVIRRRLRQKLEFLTDDAIASLEPDDATLAGYLAEHPEDFERDPLYTFEQVYLSGDAAPEAVSATAEERLRSLRAGETSGGGASLLPPFFSAAPRRVVESQFGPGFAAQLEPLPIGEWAGPVESGLGFHLVRVEEIVASSLPSFEEVRVQVHRDWAHAQRQEARRALNIRLLEDYVVEVEWPAPLAEPQPEASGSAS